MTAKNAIAATLATVACMGGLSAHIWKLEHRDAVLEIHIFALKGGRSMLLRTPDDTRILVDGGSNSEVVRKITRRLPFYSRRLDAVVLTDGSTKNASGLVDVLDRYDVSRIYMPVISTIDLGLEREMSPALAAFLLKAEEKGVAIEKLAEGDRIDFDAVNLDVLFPASPQDFRYSKASAPEFLFEIRHGAVSVAFLGSATTKVQGHIAGRRQAASMGGSSVQSGHHVGAGVTRALVVSHGATAATFLPETMDSFKPQSVVYSRSPSPAKAPPAGQARKKPPPDPLIGLMLDQRFNLKEKGDVTIVSDGTKILIASESNE